MMIKKLICAAVLLMVAGLQHTQAQYVYGTTGLLHAPSADMQRDKTFLCGFSYLQVAATPKHWNYDTWNYYINITLFPWLEVGYTCTLHKIGLPQYGYSYKFRNQDRQFSARLRVWKEGWWKEWTPQIVLGLDDPTSHADHGGGGLVSGNTSGSNNYATRYYLAVTKHLDFQNIGEWGIHAAFVYGNAKGMEHYKRPSFGTNFRFQLLGDQPLIKTVNNLNLMAEYDARTVNIGAHYQLWKDHINLIAELNNGKYFSGGIYFKIHLK